MVSKISTTKTGNVVFKVGNGKITLKNAANYADTLATIDASVVNYDFEIVGNKHINKILGGAGNDTLAGGKLK